MTTDEERPVELDYLVVHVDETRGIELTVGNILDGADWSEAPEGVALADGQAYAKLLLMLPDERMKFMAMMRTSAETAMACHMHGHADLIDRIRYVQEQYRIMNMAFAAQTAVAAHFERRMRRFMSLAHGWRQAARDFTLAKDVVGPENNDYPSCMKCGKDALPGQAISYRRTEEGDVETRHGWCEE